MSKIDSADVAKLNDSDKEELRRFLDAENQRATIQASTHAINDMCWKKCITGSIKSGSLDRSEESCITNCVQRFFDVNMLTYKNLQEMRK